MTQSQERISWLELILIVTVIFVTIFLVIYLFTGLVPFQIPQFIFNDSIFDNLKNDIGKIERVALPKNLIILGLSILSGTAFIKSFT